MHEEEGREVKNLIAALVFGIGIAIGVGAYAVTVPPLAQAADPPAESCEVGCRLTAGPQRNPDLFMYQGESLQKFSKDNLNLKDSGVWRWRFVPVAGCDSYSIYPAVRDALRQPARFGVDIAEAPDDLNAHKVYGNCGSSFKSICGGPPVIGCLGRGFPSVNDVDLSTDMAAFYDASQRAIACHEVCGHAMAVWNEQYRLDGSFASSNDVTIMNTGPLSRHDLGSAEDARWWRTMGSPEVPTLGYGFNGAWFVYACGFDANARRLSVLVSPDRDPAHARWAGVIVPIRRDINPNGGDRNGCVGVGTAEGLNIVVGQEYFLKQENPASYLASHNEKRVPY